MSDAEDAIRRGYEAFAARNLDAFRSFYAVDVVQHQPGRNRTSGEYNGIDAVLGLYGRLYELSGGTVSLKLTSVKRLGDRIVTVHAITARRDGLNLDADESMEFTFVGDRVCRLDVTYLNEAASDAFWGVLPA